MRGASSSLSTLTLALEETNPEAWQTEAAPNTARRQNRQGHPQAGWTESRIKRQHVSGDVGNLLQDGGVVDQKSKGEARNRC